MSHLVRREPLVGKAFSSRKRLGPKNRACRGREADRLPAITAALPDRARQRELRFGCENLDVFLGETKSQRLFQYGEGCSRRTPRESRIADPMQGKGDASIGRLASPLVALQRNRTRRFPFCGATKVHKRLSPVHVEFRKNVRFRVATLYEDLHGLFDRFKCLEGLAILFERIRQVRQGNRDVGMSFSEDLLFERDGLPGEALTPLLVARQLQRGPKVVQGPGANAFVTRAEWIPGSIRSGAAESRLRAADSAQCRPPRSMRRQLSRLSRHLALPRLCIGLDAEWLRRRRGHQPSW